MHSLFFKFLLGITVVTRQIEDIASLTQFCLGEERGGDKQVVLIKKPKNRLLPTFSPDFTLNRQIWLFYTEKWSFLKKLGTLLKGHMKMIQKRLAGVRFSALLKTFSLHVFFFNAFLFLVCPFWSGVGYDFRGNHGSV